jgi:hypothetical protein
VPRCLGLVPMDDRTWVTLSLVAITSPRTARSRTALGLAVGVEQALGHEVLGIEATEAGDLVGTTRACRPLIVARATLM